eukprot:scaffold38579_cov38-Tisochrysis_lutea.AAC.3
MPGMKPNPSAPMLTPACSVQPAPSAQCRSVVLGPTTVPPPTITPAPTTTLGPSTHFGPTQAFGPTTAPAPTVADGWTLALACTLSARLARLARARSEGPAQLRVRLAFHTGRHADAASHAPRAEGRRRAHHIAPSSPLPHASDKTERASDHTLKSKVK